MSAGAAHTQSEHASKALIVGYGVPVPREALARDAAEAMAAAARLGFPVVLKLCGDTIAHKTERNLVRLHLPDAGAVSAAATELLGLARPEDGPVQLLVAEQIRGRRELIAGLVRDPQFGPCVVLGLGGIFTEALGDVAFAAAPLAPGGADCAQGSAASAVSANTVSAENAYAERRNVAVIGILVNYGRR